MTRMRIAGILVIVFAIAVGILGWRAFHHQVRPEGGPLAAQSSSAPLATTATPSGASQIPPAPAAATESVKDLGPFSIAGQTYTIQLQTRKVQPASTNETGDTVVAVEIRDAAGGVQYRRTFPSQEVNEQFSESWFVSANLLTGANGTGLLVSYDFDSEPSAPEEEPTAWFQIFGVLNGKFAPFGPPMEVEGGLLSQDAGSHTYKTARPIGAEADAVEFKVWTGHCRLIFPVRVDWTQGKLAPAQECVTKSGELGTGCQYKVLPEEQLSRSDITFVRLWSNPNEKSGSVVKAVVKKDSRVDLLTAFVATKWVEGRAAGAASSKGPMDDAGGFGVAPDTDLWLKVRIDGKEGWLHSEEDFRALGLPEDE